MLSPLFAFGLVVFPDTCRCNSPVMLCYCCHFRMTLWAAFRLAQPGVAVLVNTIGILAAFLTTRGAGPFFTSNPNVALSCSSCS